VTPPPTIATSTGPSALPTASGSVASSSQKDVFATKLVMRRRSSDEGFAASAAASDEASMTTEAWDLLVRRLEAKAKSEPGTYRARVALLAALGYAVIVAALVAALGGLALTLLLMTQSPAAIKLLFVFGPLAWVILRALPVKLEPPQGIELSPSEAPELFALVETLREQASAPRIHHVRVDGDLNASVTQVPLLGWFGPTRNYLLVGLPLMDALALDEFRAVIAHELGHVSASHGRFSAWVYRIRQSWARLQASLEERGHWGAGVFRRFFRWYAPYFAAFSFVLAREHEHEADRAAVEAAGADAAATALSRLDLTARYLGGHYWPGIYGAARESAHPTAKPFVELPAAARSSRASEAAQAAIAAVLSERTGTGDTHPSLSDRLISIGVQPLAAVQKAATAPSESAAERFLGALRDDLARRLDTEWHANVAEWWAAEHRDWQEAQARFSDLDERARSDGLPRDLMLEHAHLVERFRGGEEALPLYCAVLEREAQNAIANTSIGRILLERGDENGLRHLDLAMESDFDSTLPACDLAYSFLAERGRYAEADRYRARALTRVDSLDEAYEERRTVGSRERLRDPDLPAEVVDSLHRQLSEQRKVKRAYIARRVLEHLDDEYPSYVLGVQFGFLKLDDSSSIVGRLAQELEVPAEFFVVDLDRARPMRRRMRKLSGSEIYRR
jgi:Zn-dependent protease with chaperone function